MRNFFSKLIIFRVDIISVASTIGLKYLEKNFEILKIVIVLARNYPLNIDDSSIQIIDHNY